MLGQACQIDRDHVVTYKAMDDGFTEALVDLSVSIGTQEKLQELCKSKYGFPTIDEADIVDFLNLSFGYRKYTTMIDARKGNEVADHFNRVADFLEKYNA